MASMSAYEPNNFQKEMTDNITYVKLGTNENYTQIYFALRLLGKMIPTMLCAYGMFPSVEPSNVLSPRPRLIGSLLITTRSNSQ